MSVLRSRHLGNGKVETPSIPEDISAMSITEMKSCWLPLTQEGDPGVFASHYFGTPWMSEGEKWPEGKAPQSFKGDRRLTLVLQLRVDSLPSPMAKLLGGTGLVQFFYPHDGLDGSNLSEGEGDLLRLVKPEGMSAASPAPVTPHDPAVPPHLDVQPEGHVTRAIVGWHEHPDFPHSCETVDRKPRAASSSDDDNDDGCVQGDKLGGWPFWTQACERLVRTSRGKVEQLDEEKFERNPKSYLKTRELMVPFFQLDAGCFFRGPHGNAFAPGLFAGDGTLHLSVLPSDPTVTAFHWACT